MSGTDQLIKLTRELVDIPSVSRDEDAVSAFITSRMPLPLAWSGDAVTVFMSPRTDKPLVLIAGHTDTVPINNNVPSWVEADVVFGRGTTDMKGALAVMIECAAIENAVYDVAYLFFGREELPSSESALLPALEQCALLREADFCILMEPTDNALELGCQGNLNLTVTFHGNRAHSARPWSGSNAAHSAIRSLQSLAAAEPNDVYIDDLLFREVANITAMRGGDARNVIPDHIEADINIRYAPNRVPAEVEREWSEKFESAGATVEVIGNAPGAPVVGDHPFARALLSHGAQGRTAKQAWTNAADFALYGVPTVNFGPGIPALAHRDDESVTGTALFESFKTLSRFLTEEIK